MTMAKTLPAWKVPDVQLARIVAMPDQDGHCSSSNTESWRRANDESENESDERKDSDLSGR